MSAWDTPLINANKDLVITTIIPVNADVSYPAGITLRVMNGGGFSIAAGKTLTINGTVEAGGYQIFFGAGFQNVRGLKEARGAWWGGTVIPLSVMSPVAEERSQGLGVWADFITKGPWLDARAFATLAEADAAAVLAGRMLLISSQWDVVPATLNADLCFLPGGKLNNSGSLVINGRIQAGLYQIFMGAGSVNLLGDKSVTEVHPEWWYSGSGSWHTAIQAACDCRGDIGVIVVFSIGTYVSTATVRVKYFNVHLKGQGRTATTYTFEPAVPSEAIVFARTGVTGYGEGEVPTPATTVVAYNSLTGMQLAGPNNVTKVMVKVVAADQFAMTDIKIYNLGGTRSVGLHTKGHEFHFYRDLFIYCPLPIIIDVGPTMGAIALCADHFNFHNLYLVADGYPCILWNAYAATTNVSFTGVQSWVRGTWGLRQTASGFTDTGRSLTRAMTLIMSARTEQNTAPSGYSICFEKMDRLALHNCYLDAYQNGVYYRSSGGSPGLLMTNIDYAGTGIALDAESVNYQRIQWDNCFFQNGATMNLGTLQKQQAVYPYEYALPSSAIYTQANPYTKFPMMGDATGGRVMRQITLHIEDGTTADTIKCTVSNLWNGDTIGATNNIPLNTTVGNFSLDASGSILKILDAGLTGNLLAVLSTVITNYTGVALFSTQAYASGNDIAFSVKSDVSGTGYNLALIPAGAGIYATITYITSE